MEMDIAACARSWIGTRFHHQGRLKKSDTHGGGHRGGVDCLGLLIGVSNELGLPFSQYDKTDYPHYPDTKKLRDILSAVMQELPISDIKPGDILLLSVDGNPQHLAITSEISGAPAMIHSYAPARGVVEHEIDAWWRSRIIAAFRVI